MIGWVTLPVDEAVAAWTRKQRWILAGLLLMVLAPLLGVWWAKGYWDTENQEVFVTARVTGIIDDDTVALTWRSGDLVGEGIYDDPSDDPSYEVGDEVDIAYPVGRPEELHEPQGAATLFISIVFALSFVVNAVTMFFLRVRPLRRQVELARQPGGTPAALTFNAAAGRRAQLWTKDRLTPNGEPAGDPVGSVRIGGKLSPLPAPVDDVVVRGELRPRGVVVVQIGSELLNTYGLVQSPSATDDD